VGIQRKGRNKERKWEYRGKEGLQKAGIQRGSYVEYRKEERREHLRRRGCTLHRDSKESGRKGKVTKKEVIIEE
jgi:hypothetical protein